MSDRLLASSLAAAFVAMVLVAPGGTAQSDFFVLYSFEELNFEFHPEGVPKTHSGDPDGSALVMKVRNVAVEDWRAEDLRRCMDGQSSCEYYNPDNPNWEANQDGQVQASEVTEFTAAISVFVPFIPEVRNLTELAQENITVDDAHSAKPRLQSVLFEGAEGPADSTETITAHVEIVARYDNDKGADRHVLKADDLPLRQHGFTYDTVRWTVASDDGEWKFVPEATEPAGARENTTAAGYASGQDAFEALTKQGFSLETAAEGDGGGSPGFGVVAVAAAVGVAFVALRRRRA